MNLGKQKNMSTLDPNCLGIDKIGQFKTNMKDKYISFWRRSLEH